MLAATATTASTSRLTLHQTGAGDYRWQYFQAVRLKQANQPRMRLMAALLPLLPKEGSSGTGNFFTWEPSFISVSSKLRLFCRVEAGFTSIRVTCNGAVETLNGDKPERGYESA